MAESTGSNRGLGQPPEQMSTETRLLLAFLMMGAIMFLTPYFFKSPTLPPNAKKSTQVLQTVGNPAATVTQAPPPEEAAAGAKPATAPVTQAQTQPNYFIQTDLYSISFSNQGATVRTWELKKEQADGKPLNLVNTAATNDPWPFSLYIPGNPALAQKLNSAVFQETPDPDGLGIVFDYSDGHTVVRKTFRFQKSSYLSQVTSEVRTDEQPVDSALEWRGGFGDFTVANPALNQKTIYFDLAGNSLKEQTVKAANKGPATNSGDFSFAGLEDTYFTAVFLPDATPTSGGDLLRHHPHALHREARGIYRRGHFHGRGKPLQALRRAEGLRPAEACRPETRTLVNFGWLSLLAKPLFLVVNWFNDNVVHNFGWAIVLVTLVINLALFPLKLSNMKSMRKMQALKPQVDAINAKYKNIKITDPRKGEQNQEVMELYKKYGVNPMGGCVPMLLQIPFFFAFYAVLRVSVEMRGASWLWIHDLSQPEVSAIKILPILMIGSQFLMQHMTPQANVDPSQQKMMKFMPLIFGFMFYNFYSGLVLYYLTSNLVSIGQQWFFNHTEAAQEAARSVEPPKKKKDGRK